MLSRPFELNMIWVINHGDQNSKIKEGCTPLLDNIAEEEMKLEIVIARLPVISGVTLTSEFCAISGMTSPGGKCHSFDESVNGYCRGEGCGPLVLKRLSDAVTASTPWCAGPR
mmetsp:Transcript_26744/g.50076  ORF Transcript_26744/g.50076 Transcript_26744/m.50076 type:complete len:113 (+) Transcript_26744:494-832(+)